MNLPVIKVEEDGELEIPASLVGEIAPGKEFTVESITFPSNGTVEERKGFLLVEVPAPFNF